MTEQVETVIIGGGQAGLGMSYWLAQHGREHLVLERGRIGERWRSERWDSFTLQTPNWVNGLPGFPYAGDDPDGFLPRDDVVRLLEGYAAKLKAPLRTGIAVESVRQDSRPRRYRIGTSTGIIQAQNVVVATGPFQRPKIPPFAARFSPGILQLSASEYRNPEQLPPGAVLVVGSGASGCQICEELNERGRTVYFSLGRCERQPRRYRGRDVIWWAVALGRWNQPTDTLASPDDKYRAGAQLSGTRGGHDLDYRRLADGGVVLLGHLRGLEDGTLGFAADVRETLAAWDQSLKAFKARVDDHVRQAELDAPPDEAPGDLSPGTCDTMDPITGLDPVAAGITAIIWATGFEYDYGWIELPILDAAGAPVHERGVTAAAGLYFLGLRWLHRRSSAFIGGVGQDAAYLAEHIAASA
jgi:putative flavoprotein involved in K+ transport